MYAYFYHLDKRFVMIIYEEANSSAVVVCEYGVHLKSADNQGSRG